MVGTAEGGLQVAQDGIHPVEFRYLLGLATSGHTRPVLATRFRYRGKTSQAIRDDAAAGTEMGLGPVRLGDARGGRHHRRQLDVTGTFGRERDGRHEGYLVLRAPSGLAAGPLAAEVGVIDLDFAVQWGVKIPVGHGLQTLW